MELPIAGLPEQLRQILSHTVDQATKEFASGLGQEVRRSFAAQLDELVRRGTQGAGQLEFVVESEDPPWQIQVRSTNGELEASNIGVDSSNWLVELPLPQDLRRFISRSRNRPTGEGDLLEYVEMLSAGVVAKLFNDLTGDAYYFPAARSGILQTHKAVASMMMVRSPLAGIEPMEIPRLSGVVADFIANLLSMEKAGRESPLNDIAAFLENDVIGGKISLEADKLQYPEIFYDSHAGRFPVHRTSSMVSELAPLVLYLKHIIGPGDVLILEEPESHLHPATQRRLARCITMLVRAGVQVLITTHNENFLAQLSNFVKFSNLSKRQRAAKGYSGEEYLKPEEVGLYLFEMKPEQGGSVVTELPVTLEEGLPEEEFARVIEQLYDESVYLARRLSP